MSLILPAKKRLIADPFISPNPGNWGHCTLCGCYDKLTEAHIPPQSVGNVNEWVTKSYATAIGSNSDQYYPRHFRRGLCFKTLYRDCNSRLGGREDIALVDFYGRTEKILQSPLFLGPVVKIAAKPNLLFRGVMAHIASANDSGRPCHFNAEVQDLFFGRRSLRQSSWNLFYWLYLAEPLFVMRNVFHVTWSPVVKVQHMHLLKLQPLAFLLTQANRFYGLPNVKQFLCAKDDEECDLPLELGRFDTDPVWPATTSERNFIMLGGTSFGVVGTRR